MSDGNKLPILLAVGGIGCFFLFLCGGGLAAFFFLGVRAAPGLDEPMVAYPEPAPIEVVREVEPPPPTPTAEIGHVKSGMSRTTGSYIWLVDYRNTGTVPIARPAVVAELLDTSGQVVAEQRGYGRRSVLPPGESTTILVLQRDPPEHASTRVEVRDPSPVRFEREAAMEVASHEVSGGRRPRVTGTVRNGTAAAAEFVNVVAVGRDAEGHPVAFASSFASPRDLPPGAEASFTIRVGTFMLGEPTTYEVFAYGRPQ